MKCRIEIDHPFRDDDAFFDYLNDGLGDFSERNETKEKEGVSCSCGTIEDIPEKLNSRKEILFYYPCEKCRPQIVRKVNDVFCRGMYEEEFSQQWKEYNSKSNLNKINISYESPIIKMSSRYNPISISCSVTQNKIPIFESSYEYSWFFCPNSDLDKKRPRIALMISSVIYDSCDFEGYSFVEHGKKIDLWKPEKGINIFSEPEFIEISTEMNSTIPLARFKIYDKKIYFKFATEYVNFLNNYIIDIVAVIGDNYIGIARDVDDYCYFLKNTLIAARASKSSILNREILPKDVFFYILKMIFLI